MSSNPTPPTDAQPPGAPTMTLAQCAQELAARFPALFGAQGGPLPIKLRIHVDIAARAPGVFTRRVLAAFLSRHTTSTAYLKALIKATHRTDLDGANAGEVLPEHREAATAELARRQALVQARRAQGSTGPRDSAMARRPGGPPKAESHAQAKVAREGIPGTLKSTLKGAPRAGAGPSPHRRREGRAEAISPRSSMNEDQRARADLLRAYETTTLTKANFCALKGWTEDALDQALALAREENRARRPDVTRQYSPPATRSSR